MPAPLQPATPDEQKAALEVMIGMALTNDQTPMTTELMEMLGGFPREAGIRVAHILVMLAGYAVPDNNDWRTVLQEHLADYLR